MKDDDLKWVIRATQPTRLEEITKRVNDVTTAYLNEYVGDWNGRAIRRADVAVLVQAIDKAADDLVAEIRRVQAEARRNVYEQTRGLR